MAEFPLNAPTAPEVADAIEALDDVLRLDESGEIDLPPYLTRLLLQLEELLADSVDGGISGRGRQAPAGASALPRAERAELPSMTALPSEEEIAATAALAAENQIDLLGPPGTLPA